MRPRMAATYLKNIYDYQVVMNSLWRATEYRF